jgi:hypothetical protein
MMITLSLADTETVISAAFTHYVDQKSAPFVVKVSDDKEVKVNVTLRDNSFDCGTPGYDMRNADEPALRAWVPTNITLHGDVGALTPCKDVGPVGQVNVLLRWDMMFNFHVFLTDPCG